MILEGTVGEGEIGRRMEVVAVEGLGFEQLEWTGGKARRELGQDLEGSCRGEAGKQRVLGVGARGLGTSRLGPGTEAAHSWPLPRLPSYC